MQNRSCIGLFVNVGLCWTWIYRHRSWLLPIAFLFTAEVASSRKSQECKSRIPSQIDHRIDQPLNLINNKSPKQNLFSSIHLIPVHWSPCPRVKHQKCSFPKLSKRALEYQPVAISCSHLYQVPSRPSKSNCLPRAATGSTAWLQARSSRTYRLHYAISTLRCRRCHSRPKDKDKDKEFARWDESDWET